MKHSAAEIKKAKNLLNKYAPKGEQLAYINAKESKLLIKKGGAGKMTKAGIKSYEWTGGVTSSATSDASYGDYSSSDNSSSNDGDDDAKALSYAVKSTPQRSILSRIGGFIKGAAATAFTAATFGVGTLAAIGINKTAQYVTKNINGRITRTRVNAEEVRLASAKNNKSFFVPNSKKNYTLDRGIRDNNGGNDTPPAQNVGGRIVKLSPTTAEVSQSKAIDAAAYDNRKTKAKGRSMTILKRNVADSTLILGKKSLLGM